MSESTSKPRPWVLYLALLALPIVAGLLALDRMRSRGEQSDGASAKIAEQRYALAPVLVEEAPAPAVDLGSQEEMAASLADMEALLDWLDAQPGVAFRVGELLASFASEAEANAWAARLREMGFHVLGRLNAPGSTVLRLGFKGVGPLEKLAALADAEGEPFDLGLNYLYTTPAPTVSREDGIDGNTPSREQTLALMGAQPGADWGAGVKIAVLDSGIFAHPAFGGKVPNVIDLLGDGSSTVGTHGTAVASLISGQQTGIAPGADVTMYRVLSEGGVGDAFGVAQGIYAAVADGAHILNMSLGGGDSPIVRQAIEYAQASGVVVVAAVGNEGGIGVAWPARYPGVVPVSTVDATNTSVGFANIGPEVMFATQGYGTWAASTRPDYLRSFTGTSASTPLLSGAIAALMTQLGVSAPRAVEILAATANDYGAPGRDQYLGYGAIDVNRALNYNTRGIYDAAAVGAYASDGRGGTNTINVAVQNRGTEPMPQAVVTLQAGGFNYTSTVTNLAPGQTGTATFQWPANRFGTTGTASGTLSVKMPSGRDSQSANNTRQVTISRP